MSDSVGGIFTLLSILFALGNGGGGGGGGGGPSTTLVITEPVSLLNPAKH